jgi:hypothetical protein
MALPTTVACPTGIPTWLCRLAPAPILRALALIQRHTTLVYFAEVIACMATAYADPEEGVVCLRSLILDAAFEELRSALRTVANWVESLSETPGGTRTMAVAPAGNILTNIPACVTKAGHKKGSICCAALTQLGLTQAALGFQYTTCTGRTICLACGTKTSVSKKNPGATVFSAKRVSCGVSGCPALSQIQGQLVTAA